MTKQPESETSYGLPVADGLERLATQTERDDVNEKIEGSQSNQDDQI